MIAYLRQNMTQYGLQAVKDDLINRQGYSLLEVEAASLEALKPEDPMRRIKTGLIAGAAVFMLAALAINVPRRPRAPAAPAAAAQPVPFPMPPPSRPALPAGPSDPAGSAQALSAGRADLKASRLEAALAAFDEAVRLDPRGAEARAERGLAHLKLWRRSMAARAGGGMIDAAGEHFLKGRQDLRDCAALDAKLGRVVARSLSRDGAEWVRREQEAGHRPIDASFVALAVDLAGDDPEVLNQAASAALRLGEAKKALDLLGGALAADPRSVDAHLNRAAALNALGRHPEALAALSAAEKLDPARPEIKQLRELIGAAGPPER
jgi:tetratricopeptide (TPR) repeat protein